MDSYLTEVEAGDDATPSMRIVLVEWRIKKGRESEFLDYWSKRSPVVDRSGLIAEFLCRAESSADFPWIRWDTNPEWTTYVNVGLWDAASAFQENFGRFINDSQPPLDFEADRRRRVLVAPERWRMGTAAFPSSDHPGVL